MLSAPPALRLPTCANARRLARGHHGHRGRAPSRRSPCVGDKQRPRRVPPPPVQLRRLSRGVAAQQPGHGHHHEGQAAAAAALGAGRPLRISHLDHLVLTTADEEACVRFYTTVLGMRLETLGPGQKVLCFGEQQIFLHVQGQECKLRPRHPAPGALDLCLVSEQPLDEVVARLDYLQVPIVDGPAERAGALGRLRSVHVHDPDRNLIEIAEHLP